MKGTQTQIAEPVRGAVDAAAGEAAKARGMAQADVGTPVPWADACDEAIRTMAKRGIEFQAADLIAEHLVDEPLLPAQWGPRFGHAKKAGWIEEVGAAKSKRATSRRSRLCTWRGTGAA
jgi:hypothetical protein